MTGLVRGLARDFRWGHRPLVPAGAEAHRPVRTPREFPTDWARRPAARAARAGLQAGGLVPLVHSQVTPRVSGLGELSALGEQPCVLAMNHASHLDTAVLLAALPADWRRRTAVAAAADYFFDACWRAASTALIFGTVPIERRGGAPSKTPDELLERGWNVVVFPEGTRSRDGWPDRFRLGAANLAIGHGVPVVPVSISGSFAAMPRGRSWPVRGRPRVALRFGAPLWPGEDEDVRALTDRVRRAIGRLAHEETSDWYTSLLADREAAADPNEVAATAPPTGSWRRTWASTAPIPPATSHRTKVWRAPGM